MKLLRRLAINMAVIGQQSWPMELALFLTIMVNAGIALTTDSVTAPFNGAGAAILGTCWLWGLWLYRRGER